MNYREQAEYLLRGIVFDLAGTNYSDSVDDIAEALKEAFELGYSASDRASLDKAVEALVKTRSIVSSAAMTGFNHEDGDWAQRLFDNQANISAALKAVASPQRGPLISD